MIKVDIIKHKKQLNELWIEEDLYGGGSKSAYHKKEAFGLLNDKTFISDIEALRKRFHIDFTEPELEFIQSEYYERNIHEIVEFLGERAYAFVNIRGLEKEILVLASEYRLSEVLRDCMKGFVLLDAPLVRWPEDHEVLHKANFMADESTLLIPSRKDYLQSIHDDGFKLHLKDGRLFIEIFNYTQKSDICNGSVWKLKIKPFQEGLTKRKFEPIALEDVEKELLISLYNEKKQNSSSKIKGISKNDLLEITEKLNDYLLKNALKDTVLEKLNENQLREKRYNDPSFNTLYKSRLTIKKSSEYIRKIIERLRKNGEIV